MKSKRKIVLGTLIFLFVLICGAGIFFAFAAPAQKRETASAASGTMPVQSLSGTESFEHTPIFGNHDLGTSSQYCNTGIKFYSVVNSGSASSGNKIKVDSSAVVIDFSNANALVNPILPNDFQLLGVSPVRYSLQILQGNAIKWQATFELSSYQKNVVEDGETVEKTFYKKTLNINGRTETTTSESSSYHVFTPTDFGTNVANLTDGTYTIKINRVATVTYWTNSFIFFVYSASSSASMTGTLVVDTTAPTISMKGYSSSGAISDNSQKSERVIFTVTDANPYRIYYKTPTSSSFTYTTSTTYTSGSTNGLYTVYAVDEMGNKSKEYSFYYDNVKPTGTIYCNGTSVSSGSYVNKGFSYSASDGGSGVAKLYCKTPTSGSYLQYASGTVIPATSGDGWYYFYAVDNAGNQSATMQVYLETAAPLVQIYRNNNLAYSKTVTSAGTFETNIYLNPNDTIRISCDTSSGKVSCNYTLDSNITIGSSYPNNTYTITLTTATGLNSNFVYHIVRNKPSLSVGGNVYQSGSTLYFNSDTEVSWSCDSIISETGESGMSISSEGDVNINEFIRYSEGKSRRLTSKAGTTTKYELTLNDQAGNESSFTVYIDKTPPVGEWKAGSDSLTDGGYTNQTLSFIFSEQNVTAQYSFNGGEYAAYKSGQSFTADGTYIIVLTDQAKNKSQYTAHIDTIDPVGHLYANYQEIQSGTHTKESVYFTWDGEITATVNGAPYTKNTVIVADGNYRFVLTDFAGNTATYTVEIDTLSPADNMNRLKDDKSYTVSKWYVVTFDEETKAFATYESALEYACEREFSQSATTLELSDVSEFTQTHLVASRGDPQDDVRTGTYWRYKSKANAQSELYYFDKTLLDEVIRLYAEKYVSALNYRQLDQEDAYDAYADNMYDNLWIVEDETVPCVNGFTFLRSDSIAIYAKLVGTEGEKVSFEFGTPFDEQFSLTGLYEITEVDAAGNTCTYRAFLDNSTATLSVEAEVFGEENKRELSITGDTVTEFNAYYYKSFAFKQILDNDPWTMLKVENGQAVQYFSKDDELPVLNVGGEYLITVYDRLANSYNFTVYIIGKEAEVTFTPNEDNTSFELTIHLDQKFDTLVSLEVSKDGERLPEISTNVLEYTFDKAGLYVVTIRDNFGRVITRQFQFDKTLPNGDLNGVLTGGRTAGTVTFSFNGEKYFVEVKKDGVPFETAEDTTVSFAENGQYEIKLINLTDAENFRLYTFEIDTMPPTILLDGGENKKTGNNDVTVTWLDEDAKSATVSVDGGPATEVSNGQKFVSDGKYVIVLADDLGNEATVEFTIDKTLEFSVIIDDTESIGVETTNKDICVINHEDLQVTVTKNGESYSYAFGTVLAEEGVYSFRIFDSYGNTTSFVLVIDKSVEYSISVGDGVITNEDVVIAAAEKVTAIVTKDGSEYAYTLGTKLTEEGLYRIIVHDAFGNKAAIEFRIVKGAKTQLDYLLGENVEILSITHDGEEIAAEENRLSFTVDGEYAIRCLSGGKEYFFTLCLDTTAPTVNLNGITDGGNADATVTITDLSESGSVEVYKDGELIDYTLGDELSDYGYYEVHARDELGNERVYSFTLEHHIDAGIIALIVIASIVVVGVVVVLILKKRRVI